MPYALALLIGVVAGSRAMKAAGGRKLGSSGWLGSTWGTAG
jgi:hypothetical protein